MNRRLYRCSHDRKLAGVSSGLAEYFDVDVTLVRVLFVLSIFFGGFGLLLYIVLALVVPMEPLAVTGAEGALDDAEAAGHAHAGGVSVAGHRHASEGTSGTGGAGIGGPGTGALFVGLALILFGGLALVDNVLPGWADGRFLWPAFILGIGALLVVMSLRRRSAEQ